MIEKTLALIVCIIGVLLPWRLRVAFSEGLGWITQQVYYTYYGILNFILKELKAAEEERKRGESPAAEVPDER